MTTWTCNDEPKLPAPRFPTIERYLEVACGHGSWSSEEETSRKEYPQWIIHEAESYVMLALIHNDPEWIRKRLRSAIDLTSGIPDSSLSQSAHNYLRALLPDSHQKHLDELLKELKQIDKPKPEGDSQPVAMPLQEVSLKPKRNTFRLQYTAIALLLVIGVGLMLNSFFGVWPKGGTTVSPTIFATLTIAGHSKSGDASTVYSLDRYSFEAKSQTTLPFGWLIAIDDEAAMLRMFSKNSGKEIVLTDQKQFDVRECQELFVVILAESNFEPLHDKNINWLPRDTIPGFQTSTLREAAAKIEQALRASGLQGNLQIDVRSYKHLRKQRPVSVE